MCLISLINRARTGCSLELEPLATLAIFVVVVVVVVPSVLPVPAPVPPIYARTIAAPPSTQNTAWPTLIQSQPARSLVSVHECLGTAPLVRWPSPSSFLLRQVPRPLPQQPTHLHHIRAVVAAATSVIAPRSPRPLASSPSSPPSAHPQPPHTAALLMHSTQHTLPFPSSIPSSTTLSPPTLTLPPSPSPVTPPAHPTFLLRPCTGSWTAARSFQISMSRAPTASGERVQAGLCTVLCCVR